MLTRRKYRYCGQVHKLRDCPAYDKRWEKCNKMNHFKEVCRSSKISAVNNLVQKDNQEQESDIETVNINSINTNHSIIIANLKISSKKVVITVWNKVGTGSDGNIIPLYIYIYENYFLGQWWSSWQQKEIQKVKLIMYNWTTITQLGICRVKVEHNNTCKMWKFLVVPENGQVY